MRKRRPDQVTEQVVSGLELDYLPHLPHLPPALEICLFKIRLVQKINQIMYYEIGSKF